MCETKKTGFYFYWEWIETYEAQLSASSLRRLEVAVLEYARKGVLPAFRQGSALMCCFIGIKANIDRMTERNMQQSSSAAEATRKRGGQRGNRNAVKNESETNKNESETNKNESETNKNESPRPDARTNNDNNNDNINDNDDGGGDAHARREGPSPSSPSKVLDHKAKDYWLCRETAMMVNDTDWLKAIMEKYHTSQSQIVALLPAFRAECLANGKTRHDSERDVKSHFNSWLRIQVEHGKAVDGVSSPATQRDSRDWSYQPEDPAAKKEAQRKRFSDMIESVKKRPSASMLRVLDMASKNGTLAALGLEYDGVRSEELKTETK